MPSAHGFTKQFFGRIDVGAQLVAADLAGHRLFNRQDLIGRRMLGFVEPPPNVALLDFAGFRQGALAASQGHGALEGYKGRTIGGIGLFWHNTLVQENKSTCNNQICALT